MDSAALLDSVQEAVLAVDPQGVVRGFNRAAEELLGMAAAEVCGRHLDDTPCRPEYGDEPISAALNRLFTGRPTRPVIRELTVRHRDGRRLETRAAMSVVHGSAGPLACVFLTDVSSLAAAEDAAERHNAFLTALLDSLTAGVIACDDTGRVILVNREMRRMHGDPEDGPVPADVSTTHPQHLFDVNLNPLAWEQTPLMRAWRGERLAAEDIVIRVPGRRSRVFATTAQPITGRDGRRLGAVAAAHEITVQRHAERFRVCHREVEQALRHSTSIAEAAPAILRAVTGALGWPRAELYLVDETSGSLRSVAGYTTDGEDTDGFFGHDPIRGRGISGRVWESGEPLWVADIGRHAGLVTAHERERVEMCARHGIRTVLAVPIRDGGIVLGVLTCYAASPEVHEDLFTLLLDGITAQIGVYVALRRAEELARQLTRSQNDFLDLVGHELRTPLTSISANATMLAEEATGLDDEQRQMLAAVARNTAVLQRIVDTLLDLAALDSGHQALHRATVDLAAVVAEAVTAYRPRAAETGVGLHADLPERLRADGDAVRLRQAVDDLLSNALKFSPAGGDVHVTLRAVDHLAELCVADAGIGTPEPERDRVFNRFYRAGNVRHQGIPGFGLGLTRARTIVHLHGGEISLRQRRPAGTVVCVRLPVLDESGKP
ncbi:PAS domain S-box protein [Actinoplanes sp. NEAU-H7]|uniref:Sensor-like histidine kinase SenX3 n=1 Tax=Actinoplanes flavus TaxID=2820290 RepID=A0ABS3UZS5_9ACTN|nr:PAS domain S-box protein [Actinoplanes flavus]